MGKAKKVKPTKAKIKNTSKECDSEYIQYKNAGDRITLEDSGTKLFIKAKGNIRCIQVDHGILPDFGYKINKCDYICENLDERQLHLIELKHEILDDAYNQLSGTPKAIEEHTEYGGIFVGLERLDAYIVSPGAQRIPDVSKSKPCTKLCKMLASCSRKRVDNIYELLKFVKVVQKNAGASSIEGRILCSNDKPLVF